MILTISMMILYYIGSNLSDPQFLYIDMLIILPLSVFMSWTGPYKKLTDRLPVGSLISKSILASVMAQIIIQGSFQVFI